MSSNTIDYDKLFEDLDSGELAYFKNVGVLTSYVNYRKKLNANVAKWAIYNDLKLKFEGTKKAGDLGNVILRMGRMLYSEGKYYEFKEFLYAWIYFARLPRLSLEEEMGFHNSDLGTTVKRDIEKMLKVTNSTLSFEDFKNSILSLAPSLYDEASAQKIWNVVLVNFLCDN